MAIALSLLCCSTCKTCIGSLLSNIFLAGRSFLLRYCHGSTNCTMSCLAQPPVVSASWPSGPSAACETCAIAQVGSLLQMQPFDSAGHEARLESELKKALSDHRAESLGHTPTTWDDNMAYVLMSSLAGHEQEALTGQPAANHEDFQQCIKRSIPPGCMFKGSSQHHRWDIKSLTYICYHCGFVSTRDKCMVRCSSCLPQSDIMIIIIIIIIIIIKTLSSS